MDNKQRRRILTGSASLPIILTIQSGSALAATSSACRVKDAGKTQPALLPEASDNSSLASAGPDEWMRKNIQLVNLKVDGAQNFYTGPSGSTNFFRNIEGSYYFEFTDTMSPPTLLNGLTAPKPGAVNVVETDVANGVRSALVHVDESGKMTGFAWDTSSSGQKITSSCWTSFA